MRKYLRAQVNDAGITDSPSAVVLKGCESATVPSDDDDWGLSVGVVSLIHVYVQKNCCTVEMQLVKSVNVCRFPMG